MPINSYLDRYGGPGGFASGNPGVFGGQPMANPLFNPPTSPLASGYGGLYGTGSYLGTMASYSPSSSPFAIGIPPSMMGSPGLMPTPSGNVPMVMIPNGMGGYSYLPVGNPGMSGGSPYPTSGYGGTPSMTGGSPTYAMPGSGSSLGLSFGGGGGQNIFAGVGGGMGPAPTLGGAPYQARTPFGPTGPGTPGYNASQNTYAGRNLGAQTSPNATLAGSGGTRPPGFDAPVPSGILGGAAVQGNVPMPPDPMSYLNPPGMSGVWTPPSTPPWNGGGGGGASAGGAPNQAPNLVNYPDSLSGGVQMYFGADGRPVYTNPGSIGLPGSPSTQPSPGTQPGSTGFAYPSAFGPGGSYYSTPPGGITNPGPTGQALLGYGGAAPTPGAPISTSNPGAGYGYGAGGGTIFAGSPLSGAPGAGAPGGDQVLYAGNDLPGGGKGSVSEWLEAQKAGGGASGFPGAGGFGGPNGGAPAPGTPMGIPGFPGMPSTAGPFSTDNPLGMGGNLLVNEVARREGLLNTAQQQYQNALGTITGSPVASGVNALLNDLIANPYPYSSDSMRQNLTGMVSRRIGQGTEAARASVRQSNAEAGLRGGEAAGLEAGTTFKGNAALADAITQIERDLGLARTQERQAASGILGAGGQTLAQSVFGPQMEAASFFERRSNPEIQALMQLLGQDQALKVAMAIAQMSGQQGLQSYGGVQGPIISPNNNSSIVLQSLLGR